MKVKFESNRLQFLVEPDSNEEWFVKTLVRRITDSNNLMSWYGDVEFDGKETSGYIITWQPEREPGKGIPKVKEE